MKGLSASIALMGATALMMASQASAETFKPGVDADGNGELSVEEFVLGHAEFDLGRFDENKDGVLAIQEFLKVDSRWHHMLVDRFNKDNDGEFSSEELVDMYLFMFTNRDKDESGTISIEEAPRGLLQS